MDSIVSGAKTYPGTEREWRVVELLQVYGSLNRGPNATPEEEALRDECVREMRVALFPSK